MYIIKINVSNTETELINFHKCSPEKRLLSNWLFHLTSMVYSLCKIYFVQQNLMLTIKRGHADRYSIYNNKCDGNNLPLLNDNRFRKAFQCRLNWSFYWFCFPCKTDVYFFLKKLFQLGIGTDVLIRKILSIKDSKQIY